MLRDLNILHSFHSYNKSYFSKQLSVCADESLVTDIPMKKSVHCRLLISKSDSSFKCARVLSFDIDWLWSSMTSLLLFFFFINSI